MTNETLFHDIPNFFGYQVNKLGTVRKKDIENIGKDGKIRRYKSRDLKEFDNGKGYKFVILRIGGKTVQQYVHRLVGYTFLGLTKEKEINHIDGDKSNNILSNLEVCNRKENVEHANKFLKPPDHTKRNIKLNKEKVLDIRRKLRDNISIKRIAREYKIKEGYVRQIKCNHRWANVQLPE